MIPRSAAHPDGSTNTGAKVAALLCFAIAAGLLVMSMLHAAPAKAGGSAKQQVTVVL